MCIVSVVFGMHAVLYANTVNETVGRPSVSLAGKKYRSIGARPALSSKCDQCDVVSWRRKLNADLLIFSLCVASNMQLILNQQSL